MQRINGTRFEPFPHANSVFEGRSVREREEETVRPRADRSYGRQVPLQADLEPSEMPRDTTAIENL